MGLDGATDRGGRVSLMQMEIDAVTEAQTIERIESSLGSGGGWVITPNLDHLRQYCASPALREHFARADLVVADGMPLVWASRIQDTPLPERVAGSDLIWSVAKAAGRGGASLYLVGGNPGTAQQAGELLAASSPGLRIAGASCPVLDGDAGRLDAVVDELRAATPDVVYVGLPLDKQVILIPALRKALPNAWVLGLGVSFSFVTGDVDRAPRWMQRLGIEWIHRMSQEPKRLARRYLLEGIPFAIALLSHALVRRAFWREVPR